MMVCRWTLAMVMAVQSILYLGICIGLSCDRETHCPSALYKDGSIVKSLARISNNSDDRAIVIHLVNCHTSNACLNNPCQNGGSCLEDNTGSYYCHCVIGFDGETCDILAQLLIRTDNKKHILLANVSDFSFSTLFTTDDDTDIEGFVFDEEDGTIYFAHTTLSSFYYFHIRKATGINTSIIIIENAISHLIGIGIYYADHSLFWASHREFKRIRLPVRHLNPIPHDDIDIDQFPKKTWRFVIDQKRGYMYSVTSDEIYRKDLEHNRDGYTLITDHWDFYTPDGFSLDEDDERLYFTTTVKDEYIFYYDLRRGTGVRTLTKLDGRNPTNIISTGGWFIYADAFIGHDGQLCQIQVTGPGASVKYGLCVDAPRVYTLTRFRGLRLRRVKAYL